MAVKVRTSAFSIIVVFILLMILGLAFLPKLSIRLHPSRTLPSLTVSYTWSNASPRLVEQNVTAPLEGLFNTILGIQSVESTSYQGGGRITLGFDKKADMDAMRFEVASKVREVFPKLPDAVRYPRISQYQTESDEKTLLTYTLNAPSSPRLIQQYVEDVLSPRLSHIEGLYKIRVYGATDMEWELIYDQEQLNILGLNKGDISSSLQDYFREEVVGMGWDRSGALDDLSPKAIIMKSVSLADSSWLQIPVGKVEGRIVRISDLCRVIHKEKEPRSYYRINGNNTINVVFTSEKGANSLTVASDIKRELTVLAEDFPPGYFLLLSSDSTETIKEDLNKIYYRTIFSFAILLLFVFLISRQFRYLMIIFISLLANLCTAFILYFIFKVEVNLYSLAGITVSLGLIIDNTIVMVDHIRTKGNKKVFLAIMAATLTTIGALSVIRFFGETTRLQLKDFSMVLIINLFVSLMVALFLVPSLMEKIPLKVKNGLRTTKRRRRIVGFSYAYGRMIAFSQRYRWGFILMAILLFGLPTFKIPTRMEGDEWYHKVFQKTLASDTYVQKIKPVVDKALGGTFRLFSQHFRERWSYRMPERTKISVTASLPQGSTLQQMNDLMIEVEHYLKGAEQIDQFVTRVSNARNGQVMVSFKPDYELGAFPFILLSQLQDLANNLTGADWRVYGLGQAFSNSLTERIGQSKIVLYGYNYEELMGHAITLRDNVLALDRVEKSSIISQNTYMRDPVFEFGISLDPQKLQARKLNAMQVYRNLEGYSIDQGGGASVFIDGAYEQISLRSTQSDNFDIWMMGNTPVEVNDAMVRLDDLGEREKQELNKTICKENQQYRLIVEYDFIGNYKLGQITRDRIIREMSEQLPIGYTIKQSEYRYWQREANKQFFLILMVIAIIYMICAILLESLKQPLAVVLIIPVSYVGVFLTFFLFDFTFDQGGFAAFLLLSGFVVKAAVYILNGYDNYNKKLEGRILPIRMYLKAFNGKIIPIFLTVLSTVFGLVPFIAGGEDEAFWFALAAGTMGGLIFSVAAIFVFLPAFLSLKPKKLNK